MNSIPSSGIDDGFLTEPVTAAPLHLVQSDGDRPVPNLAVVLATLGRPSVVTSMLDYLLRTQSLKPSAVIVSCVVRADVGDAANLPGVTGGTEPPGPARS